MSIDLVKARRVLRRRRQKKQLRDLGEMPLSKPDRMSARSMPAYSPHGLALLRDPLLNKGTGFTEEEREALGLRGFLPAAVMSMQAQAERVMTNLRTLPSDLEKYVALNSLHDRNEALFFRVVCDHIDE